MTDIRPEQAGLPDQSYSSYIETVKKRIGMERLTDDDLIALAFDEISHTFTREEKNYK